MNIAQGKVQNDLSVRQSFTFTSIVMPVFIPACSILALVGGYVMLLDAVRTLLFTQPKQSDSRQIIKIPQADFLCIFVFPLG